MTLHLLAGLYIPKLQQLRNQLVAKQRQPESRCMICLKQRKSDISLLVNYELLEKDHEDLVILCSRCSHTNQLVFKQPLVSLPPFISCIQTVLDCKILKQANILAEKIIKNVSSKPKNKGFFKKNLIEIMKQNFHGYDEDDEEINEYQRLTRRTCQLVYEIYNEIKGSILGNIAKCMNNNEFKVDGKLLIILQEYAKRESKFKLEIMTQLQEITRTTVETDNLQKWVRRSLQALNGFAHAFAKTKENEDKVIFSISRNSVQYRYNYDPQKQAFLSELVRAQLPFYGQAVILKVVSFEYNDQVDLGIFYGKKNAEDPYQSVHAPLLFRFNVNPHSINNQKQIFTSENASESEEKTGEMTHKNKRLDRSNRNINQLKIVSQKEDEGKKLEKSSCESIQIDDEDEISFDLDYNTQVLKIRNKTKDILIIEKKLKNGCGNKFTVYPCVRFVGTRVMVEKVK